MSEAEPPENCRGKFCIGTFQPDPRFAYAVEVCPLDGPECPFHRDRLLGPLGIGVRYRNAQLDLIPESDARKLVAAYLESISEHVSAGEGLFIQGGVGTGKTSILVLVAYAARTAGHSVAYWYGGELFNRLHRDDQEAIGYARSCDLLLLDDFGCQYAIDWTISRFDALVEYRYAHRRVMCITTNILGSELKETPAWRRVYDRWDEMCEGITSGQESMR